MDRITDLPVNYSKYLTNRRPDSVQSRSLSSPNLHAPQLSQPEPLQQYRSPTYNYPSMFLFYLHLDLHSLYYVFLGAYTTTYRASYTNRGPNRLGYGPFGGTGAQSASYTKYA